MKKLKKLKGAAIIAALTLGITVQAQTTDTVTASGMSFTPNSLTINVGDSVVFNNTGGFHNINGTIATFPSNPASFGNGNAANAPWTYGFRFTVAGHYDYRCDIHFSSGMVGSIDVQDTGTTTGITKNSKNDLSLFPNPTNNKINIKNAQNIKIAFIYDDLGNKVMAVNKFTYKGIDISNLPIGIFFIKVIYKKGNTLTQKFIKE